MLNSRKSALLVRHRYDIKELSATMGNIASSVKLVCGVVNNATLLVMLDAHDKVRQHPAYRQKVKQLYCQAIKVYRQQERELLYARTNRMFHLADMPAEVRKKYGEISDSQYFEYWQGLGARAYTGGRPWLTSLQNKYRLSLQGHSVEHAEILAWVMTAQACLELSCTMYESQLRQSTEVYHIPIENLRPVFDLFSMRKTADLWYQALALTDPVATDYELDPVENRNIALGIRQLQDAWSDPKMLYGAAITATEDFDDIFRTKGENKKALREINERMAETEAELKK